MQLPHLLFRPGFLCLRSLHPSHRSNCSRIQRVPRMQNHLRVVADIFYENYDERKFHYILDRIMVLASLPRTKSTESNSGPNPRTTPWRTRNRSWSAGTRWPEKCNSTTLCDRGRGSREEPILLWLSCFLPSWLWVSSTWSGAGIDIYFWISFWVNRNGYLGRKYIYNQLCGKYI